MPVVSAKFLLRRALACAKLARETTDADCRERCLRLEKVYRELALQGDGGREVQPVPGRHDAATA
ncbi:MAG: hypothetical protein ACOY5F_21535 [Pseudomonadota bacterium]